MSFAFSASPLFSLPTITWPFALAAWSRISLLALKVMGALVWTSWMVKVQDVISILVTSPTCLFWPATAQAQAPPAKARAAPINKTGMDFFIEHTPFERESERLEDL